MRFRDLLRVAEKLVAVAQGGIPGAFVFTARGLAFDEQQGLALIVADENVGPAAAGAVTDFPLRLQFDVLWFVALRQQTVHTFQHNEVFCLREITGLPFVDDEAGCFGILNFFFGDVDGQQCAIESLAVNRVALDESQVDQDVGQIVLGNHSLGVAIIAMKRSNSSTTSCGPGLASGWPWKLKAGASVRRMP